MLWAFAESEDRLLNEYSTDEAWPSIIDSFVEWKYEKEGRTFKSEVRQPSTRALNMGQHSRPPTHTHTHTHLHAWTQQSTFTIDTSAFDYRWNTTNGDSASRTGDSPSAFLSSVGGASSSVTSMFSTSYSWTSDYRGLYNQGATCYMNSLLQTLFMTPEFRRILYHWDAGQLTAAEQADCWPLQLQRLFARLQFGLGSAAVPTRALNQSFRDPFSAGGPDPLYALQHNSRALCQAALELLAQRFAGTPQGWFLSAPFPSGEPRTELTSERRANAAGAVSVATLELRAMPRVWL